LKTSRSRVRTVVIVTPRTIHRMVSMGTSGGSPSRV
jgi:hypothetical protein